MRKRKTMLHNSAWRMMLLIGCLGGWTAPAAWARQDDQPPAPEPAIITGHVGDVIQIGAGASPRSAGEHWELVSHPDGSQAALRSNPWVPGLRLQPDVNGVYVVDDEDASNTVLSETRIEIGTAGASAPVQTRVVTNTGSQSEDYSIVVNGKSYPAQAGLPPQGVMILVLQRDTLELKAQSTLDAMSEAKTYLQGLLNRTDLDALYIISSLQSVGGRVSTIAPELQRLGANQEFAGITDSKFTFTFVGSKNWSPGQAYQAGYLPASGDSTGLSGSFVRDSHSNYTFVQTDYTRFTLQPSTDGPASIQVGNAPSIQSTPKALWLGGFLLAVFDRASLEVQASDTYYTFSKTYDTTSEIQRLVKDLQTYRGNEKVLLALVSFGQPYQGFDSLFANVARAVSRLGGTYEAVYDLNGQDTYALLTSSDPPASLGLPRFPMAEVGSQVNSNAASGALTGVLARGRRGNWYAPAASTTAAGTNLELYSILAQTPVPFPHPAPGQAVEQEAYQYISNRLCRNVAEGNCSDLRGNYNNFNFVVENRLTILTTTLNEDFKDSAINCNRTTAQTDYCTVYNQLVSELIYVGDIRAFDTNWDTLWTKYQSTVSTALTAVQESIKKQTRLDMARRAEPIIPSAVSTFFTIASYVPGTVGAIAGVVNGTLLFTSAVADQPDGKNLVFEVEATAGELADQANEAFLQQIRARAEMFSSIYEDWGKLQTLGQALQSGNELWRWERTKEPDVLAKMNTAFKISAYRSFLSSLYVRRIWNAQSSQVNLPDDYKYVQRFDKFGYYSYSIFRFWKDNPGGFLASPSPRTDKNGSQLDLLMLAEPGKAYEKSGDRFTYEQVPAFLLTPIFGPNGLGVPKPEVYRRWPFQTFYCSAPGNKLKYQDSTPTPSNCDFTTPQLPQ